MLNVYSVLFLCIPGTLAAPCLTCFGFQPGCTFETTGKCPLVEIPVANLAITAKAGVGGALVLQNARPDPTIGQRTDVLPCVFVCVWWGRYPPAAALLVRRQVVPVLNTTSATSTSAKVLGESTQTRGRRHGVGRRVGRPRQAE